MDHELSPSVFLERQGKGFHEGIDGRIRQHRCLANNLLPLFLPARKAQKPGLPESDPGRQTALLRRTGDPWPPSQALKIAIGRPNSPDPKMDPLMTARRKTRDRHSLDGRPHP